MIEKGRVAEAGTHDELIERRGVYYNYYARQAPERAAAPAVKEPALVEIGGAADLTGSKRPWASWFRSGHAPRR